MKMKKVLLIAAILMMGYSANSFAAATTSTPQWGTATSNGTWTLGTTVQLTGIKPSANVSLAYGATSETINSATTGIAYSFGTYHSSGTFSYGSSSGDTNIFRYPKNDADNTFTPPPASPATATAGCDWTGWTAAK